MVRCPLIRTLALADARLSPVKSTAVYADLQLNDVERTQSGEYATSSLAAHVNTPAVNMLIVRTYLHRARECPKAVFGQLAVRTN